MLRGLRLDNVQLHLDKLSDLAVYSHQLRAALLASAAAALGVYSTDACRTATSPKLGRHDVDWFNNAQMDGSVVAMSKRALKTKRRSKAVLPALGLTGLSLSLASGATASTGEETTNLPSTSQPHEIFLGGQEISDDSLSTFYVFDKENAAQPKLGEKVAWGCRGCGCRGCRCGCRCGWRGCWGCGGCGGCCWSWGRCAWC